MTATHHCIKRRDNTNSSRAIKLFAIVAIICTLSCFIEQHAFAQSSDIDSASQICRNGSDAADRVRSCSYVIAHTKDLKLVEKSYNRRGHANLVLHRYPEAANDFSQVIRANPKIAGYYDNRQYALRMMGQLDNALRDANQAINLAPSYSFVYRSRGNIYSDKQQIDLAIADFTQAIELDKLDASLLVDRARLYSKKSLDSLAIKDLTQALEIDPRNSAIVRERGLAYSRLGLADKAKVDLIAHLRDNPQDAEATSALNSLSFGNKNNAASKNSLAGTEKTTSDSLVPLVLNPRENRVALVLGNSEYLEVGRLENPIRDAEAVAGALRAAGFRMVYQKANLGYDGLRRALADFSAEADKADWALVYYAGHGIEVDGMNYLVPIDARLKTDRAVQLEAVSLEQLMGSIAGARKLSVVILDACRNNPFLERMARTGKSRSLNSGLAKVDPYGSTMVAFSAKAGQLASDGVAGQRNSPFVNALVKHLTQSNVDIRKFFGLVRDDVLAATDRRQEPAIYGSLGGDDYFIKTP